MGEVGIIIYVLQMNKLRLRKVYFFFSFKNNFYGVPIVVQWVTNPTSTHEDAGSIHGLAQWVKGSRVPMSCGAGCR